MARNTRLSLPFVIILVILQFLSISVNAADCSKTNLCKIGCCSKDGFCGTTTEHCGSGCLSTCDYKPPPTECSTTKLCATGCCSKDGFCGTTEEHCGKGCQSTCDFKLGCDKNNPCKDGTCCSKFGFCGLGPDFCSKDNCVAGCGAKTFCDPGGYGPEFAKNSKCPLNVCCSKWGYCGLTEEFCGKKKVKRPSCSAKDRPLRRVVGYYEGWATGRSCDKFSPSDIPDGVYTHINFAFASIDPNTFKIVPAAAGDPDLYRQLTNKKAIDPNLKVFIAIGGWTFNDPGPTATTFSDIARSEANQRAFISSLISFMNTYNFDGVDIDWEYPEAPDRQGRGEDFVNLPKFLSNIKAALNQNGAKNGLSIAIPASYWYLQHFDIVNIAKYVDYFNVMTYDFHGSWDTPESWLGNHLNSHTNLTEITDAFDLLWRNDIRPEQVNMGLAFYSRTFTVSNPGCMSPGCLFDSGGPKAACSNAVGVLSNAEISRLSSGKAVQVEFDKKAAVKILTTGREWLTYDDGETWQLKLDFARSQCLGGAMVWAISQDTADGKFAKQLQAATGYKSQGVVKNTVGVKIPGGTFIEVTIPDSSNDITKEQCRWTNCGQACPSGWQAVKRGDQYKESISERMWDDTGCDGTGSRTFCCPPGDQPVCQWLYFNGGKCEPGFGDKTLYEIASTKAGCNNGKAQVASCGGDTSALDAYRKCRWHGKEPKCATEMGVQTCSESNTYNSWLFSSLTGSGDQVCKDSGGSRRARPYCCDVSDKEAAHWKNCELHDDYKSSLTHIYGTEHCYGNCPGNKIRVGLQKNVFGGPTCPYTTQAWCCDAEATISAKTKEKSYDDALKSWVKNPTCPSKGLISRDAAPVDGSDEPTLVRREWPLPSEIMVRDALEVFIENPPNSKMIRHVREVWDEVVGGRWENLGAAALSTFWYPLRDFLRGEKQASSLIAAAVACNMDSWDKTLGSRTQTDTIHCPLEAVATVQPSLLLDPDVANLDQVSTTVISPLAWMGFPFDSMEWLDIEERDGSPREFKVQCPNRGSWAFKIYSEPYINGGKGEPLKNANGDKDRWYVDNQLGNCFGFGITNNGTKDSDKWVSEHILELATVKNFIEFTIFGKLDAKSSSKSAPYLPMVPSSGQKAPCSMWETAFKNGFPAWSQNNKLTPQKKLFTAMGSKVDPDDMVNCEEKLNGMKMRIWSLNDPVAVDNWNDSCAKMTKASAETAIANLQLVYGVWQYLNAPAVQTKLINTYLGILDVLEEFEDAYQDQFGGPNYELGDILWREYMTHHLDRMLTRSEGWARGRLNKLLEDWRAQLVKTLQDSMKNPNLTAEIVTIWEIITALMKLDLSFRSTFVFDKDIFLHAD